MADNFDANVAKALMNTIEGAVNEDRLQQIYDEIEAEYDRQHNIEPREVRDAPPEYLELYGIELTPMLLAVLLCVTFVLWHLLAALH